MSWSVWGSISAKGSGKYTFNTCTPTCVAGRFVNDPAMVTLGSPKSGPHGRVFTKMFVRYRLSAKRQVSLTVMLPLKAFTNPLG
jgi:protocatechuate 3,4-dioxygenase beta subunit